MIEHKIDKSIEVLNSIKNYEGWSGSMAESFNLELTDIIDCLNEQVSNINRYNSAYELLWEIKNIDNANDTLRGYKINTNNIENEGELNSSLEFNSFIDSMINSNLEKRESIKNKIIDILNEIVGVESGEIINVTSIENAVILEKYDTGCVYEFVSPNGGKYQAYVPYNVDINKEVIVYDSGGMSGNTYVGSGEFNLLKEYFKTEGYDYIMIKSERQDTSGSYQDLCNRLNLSPESRLFISFSGGFRTQYDEYYDLAVEEGSSPGVIAMMDSYINNNPKYIDKLVEDETILFGFHQNFMNEAGRDYVSKGKVEGLNLLILSDQSEYGRSHAGMRDSLWKNGVLDYLTGDGELPDNYVVKYYNPNGEGADEAGYCIVDYSQVKTLDDVYNFFGVDKNKIS